MGTQLLMFGKVEELRCPHVMTQNVLEHMSINEPSRFIYLFAIRSTEVSRVAAG